MNHYKSTVSVELFLTFPGKTILFVFVWLHTIVFRWHVPVLCYVCVSFRVCRWTVKAFGGVDWLFSDPLSYNEPISPYVGASLQVQQVHLDLK